MFFLTKLKNCSSSLFCIVKNIRFHFNDKNFDAIFRNNGEYKNLVVPLDKKSNKYNVSVSSELQSVEGEVFFNGLMQRDKVMKLSSLQVKDVLGLMANTGVDIAKYDLPLKFLDEKCAVSVDRWPLDLSFYILDIWCIILGPKVFKKHYYSAISSQWSMKIKKCSKSNLILILHFIGLSKSPQPFLMDAVLDKMENIITEFSNEEIALACLSFFKCSKSINSSIFLEQACKSATNLLKKQDHFNAINILKCLRLSKYYKKELWHAVNDYGIREADNFNLVECTNLLALFATQNMYDKDFFKSLESRAYSVLLAEEEDGASEKCFKTHPSLRSRVKDFARFLWSMTTVGHPVKENILKLLVNSIEKRIEMGEYEPQLHVLIDTLQSFVLANYYPSNIFLLALTSSNCKKIYNSDRAKPKYQLYFVEKSVVIEQPEFYVHKTNVINPIPKQLKKEIEGRKGFAEMIRLVEEQYPNNYKTCYLLPHIMIAGIFLARPCSSDTSSNAFHRHISDGLIARHVQPMLKRNQSYLSIEILDPSVCVNESKQLSGLMQVKIRQLKKLGFQVISLYSDEVENLLKRNSDKDFDVHHSLFAK